MPAGLALVELEGPARLPGGSGLRVILPGGSELHLTSQDAVPWAAALIRELSRPWRNFRIQGASKTVTLCNISEPHFWAFRCIYMQSGGLD
jgi:hypothetical protein